MKAWLFWLFKNVAFSRIKTNKVHIADSPDKQKSIFRFRYDVYCKEMNKSIGTKHEDELLFDVYDWHPSTVNFYYENINKVQGVLRLTCYQQDVPAEVKQKYSLNGLSQFKHVSFAEISYVMVDRKLKNKLIFPILVKRCLEYLYSKNIKIDVIFCCCKPGLFGFYKLFGAINHSDSLINFSDGVSIPLCIVMSKESYFKEIRSPFYSIVKSYSKKMFNAEDRQKGENIYSTIISCKKSYSTLNKDIKEAIKQFLSHCDLSYLTSIHNLYTALLHISDGVLKLTKGDNLTLAKLDDAEMYFIIEGLLQVSYVDNKICKLVPGQIAGEMSFFLSEQKRAASLQAIDDTSLIVLRRGELKRAIANNPKLAKEILLLICYSLAIKLKTTTYENLQK